MPGGHGGGGGGGHGGGGGGHGHGGFRGPGWGGGVWGPLSVYDYIDAEDFGVVGAVVPDALVADMSDDGGMYIDAPAPIVVMGSRRRPYGLLG